MKHRRGEPQGLPFLLLAEQGNVDHCLPSCNCVHLNSIEDIDARGPCVRCLPDRDMIASPHEADAQAR